MFASKNKWGSVHVYEPDRSLQVKIGLPNLDTVFTSQAIDAAQNVIAQSSEGFLADSIDLMEDLTRLQQKLCASNDDRSRKANLVQLVDAAFRLKAKTGLGGYTLIADVAKSLQLHSEQALAAGITDKYIKILVWHVDSLHVFLSRRIKGTGGDLGRSILQEIAHLSETLETDPPISQTASGR